MGLKSQIGSVYAALFISGILQANGIAKEEPNEHLGDCDLFQGSWVYDGTSYPLYNTSTCPFIQEQFNCQGNGRPDKFHLHYRWKPGACAVPEFSGQDFLRRMKEKKILFRLHRGKMQPWDYIQIGDAVLQDTDRLLAFREGLTTWSKWVQSNIDPAATKVFFQGISPTHYNCGKTGTLLYTVDFAAKERSIAVTGV